MLGCSPSEEAAKVVRPVAIDGAGVTAVQTDLGYTVTLTQARAVITQVQFVRAADVVAWSALSLILGTAHAHPGHGEGGALVGELPGEHVVDWVGQSGAALGDAVLIGAANTVRFTFAAGSQEAGSVQIAGVASKDGVEHPFAADFDLADVAVEGVPFLPEALEAAAWGLRFTAADPFEDDTLFDGIDFATATWSAGDEGHNRLGRALRTHDHYLVSGVAR
ncbi:MAG: hypothetical protein ACI9U2_003915 [Bradymonadia bacterium]|jgi:hypothetical protein